MSVWFGHRFSGVISKRSIRGTHFDYIAAPGDNSAVRAPSERPSASLLASLVPPRSVGADVADWRRSVAGWLQSATAFGRIHRPSVGAETSRLDEDLGLSGSIFSE